MFRRSAAENIIYDIGGGARRHLRAVASASKTTVAWRVTIIIIGGGVHISEWN